MGLLFLLFQILISRFLPAILGHQNHEFAIACNGSAMTLQWENVDKMGILIFEAIRFAIRRNDFLPLREGKGLRALTPIGHIFDAYFSGNEADSFA